MQSCVNLFHATLTAMSIMLHGLPRLRRFGEAMRMSQLSPDRLRRLWTPFWA